MKFNVEQAARICHEANREYCQTLGDISQLPWDAAPQWQKDSAIKGVEFHLSALEAGMRPNPAASHESWLMEKQQAGWKYGPVKDPEKKEHPCYVPYAELPPEQKAKDYLFCAIVEALWRAAQADGVQSIAAQ